MPMTRQEIDGFLAQTNIAVVAVTAPNGAPHAIPTWYEYRDGVVTFLTDKTAFKYKCLNHDPRVAFIVDTKTAPYKAVVLKGSTKMEERIDDAFLERMAIAYLGEKEGRAYAKPFKGNKVVVVSFRPAREISWDYSRDV